MQRSIPIIPDILSLVGLVIITFVPSVGHLVTTKESTSNVENRYLAKFPTKAEGVTDFTQQIDYYLNDHFGFRQLAIRAERKIKRIWGDGETSVYNGIEGWLFWSESTIWDSYLGRSDFSKGHLESLADLLSNLRSVSNDNGVAFAATIVPNKTSVYTEFVPKRFGEKSPRNFYDYFLQHLEIDGLNFVDVKQRLVNLKSQNQVYFKTDTHWTFRGAYEGYRALVDSLKLQEPSLDILYEQDLKKEFRQKFSGDLSGFDGVVVSEDVLDITEPRVEGFERQVIAESASHKDLSTIVYERPMNTGRSIVIVGDSFSKYYLSFFKRDFDRIVFIHHKLGDFSIDEVFDYNPDFVVFSPVERYAESIAVSWKKNNQ